MKAIIMAGGEGTRLRAVTGDTPKPLVSFLGRPMMEHIILLLKRHGFTDICITLRYKAEMISALFGDGSQLGVKLCYRIESSPCGTAGGVKNCADFYGGEDFLVISGDAACDLDLAALMRAHTQSGAAASIALCRCSDPTSFGLAVTDEQSRIRAFVEKPAWPQVVTDLVNTGIYILSPAAMSLVPCGEFFDFGRDLFPLLLKRGMKMYGAVLPGYWCDVGTPLSYYRCCVDALEGRLKLDLPKEFLPAEKPSCEESGISAGFTLEYPCRDRAALMGALSGLMLEMGAEYTDGLRVNAPGYALHISPLASRTALKISVQSADAEFAQSLALSARSLAEAIDKQQAQNV